MSRVRYYANKYGGTCERCGQAVPAGKGRIRRGGRPGMWITSHRPAEWRGSPISGRWVDGCPPPPVEADDVDPAEQAYGKLYFHLTGDTGTPPPLHQPATAVDRQKLHVTLTWLALLLDKSDLDTDRPAQEALRRFADEQGWT